MIRIVRILEYEYPDTQTMTKDIARWYIPAMGTRNQVGSGVKIRSSIMLPDEVTEETFPEGVPPIGWDDNEGTLKQEEDNVG